MDDRKTFETKKSEYEAEIKNVDSILEDLKKKDVFPSPIIHFAQEKLNDSLFKDGIYTLKLNENEVTMLEESRNPSTLAKIENIKKDDNEYSVAKVNGRFYGISEQKVGTGATGAIRFALDFNSNEWMIIKIQEVQKEKEEAEISSSNSKRRMMRKSDRTTGEGFSQVKEKTKKEINILEKMQLGTGSYNISAGNQQQFIIVMKYISGNTLSQMIKDLKEGNIKLSLKEKLQIASGFLSQMQKLKDEKFYHCDLSPKNIKVDKNGNVKLLDYGNASPLQTRWRDARNIPAEDTSLGTPGYRPVEALTRPTEKSEIWSAGVILSQLFEFAELNPGTERSGPSFKWLKTREEVAELDKKEPGLLEVFDYINKMKTDIPEVKEEEIPEPDIINKSEEELNKIFEEYSLAMDERKNRADQIKEQALAERPTIEQATKAFSTMLGKAIEQEKVYSTDKSSMTQFGTPGTSPKTGKKDLSKSPSEGEKDQQKPSGQRH